MLELARCHGESPVLMSVLAKRESLSRKYLHGLLTALKEAGLVRSVRGPAIARMVGHITYLSEQGMHEKFDEKKGTFYFFWTCWSSKK